MNRSALKALVAGALLWVASALPVLAQTAPNWTFGYVPTTAQWNAVFAGKQDYLGAPPVLTTGGTMTGKLTTAASTTTGAGLNLPAGTAPTSPVNGDLWTTATGIFAQINGATINLTGAASTSFAATSPITVSFPAGIVTYACATCGVTGSPLSQFAATTSAQLRGIISDESGAGVLVFGTGPTLTGVTITTSFTATGLVGLPSLASQTSNTIVGSVFVGSPSALPIPPCNGSANALQWTSGTGFGCGAIVAAAGSVAVGTTTITGGTINNILVHGASNILQEYTLSGTGTVVAMAAAPVIVGGSHTAITNLGVRSTAAAFDMVIANSEVLTANRALTITLGDSARSLTFGGNIVTGNSFTTSGNFSLILTQTGATNVTLPTTGTLATQAGVEALSNKTINGITITASTGTLTLNTNTLAVAGSGVSLTLAGTTGTTMTFPTTSATLARTDAGQTFSGVQTFSGNVAIVAATLGIQSSAATALAVGPNGTTNPAFNVDASTASSATGINIKSAAAGGNTAVSVISSGTNEGLTLNAKGTGAISIGGSSTGQVQLAVGGGGVFLGSATIVSSGSLSVTGSDANFAAGGNRSFMDVGRMGSLNGGGAAIGLSIVVNGGAALTFNTSGQISGTTAIAGGASVTSQSLTTGSITVDCTTRPLQQIVGSTSAWSITAPSTDSSCIIKLTNAASSAVVPSFSGFSVGTNTGDPLTAVGSSAFIIWIARIGGTSTYSVKALQ